MLTISGNRVTTTSDSPLKLCRVDHGGDVEWSLVLFVATGETEHTSAAHLGGSLLLKTQLGPVALQQHGFLPVTPVPGELWASPGYMPHCVMPRAVGAGSMPSSPEPGARAALLSSLPLELTRLSSSSTCSP